MIRLPSSIVHEIAAHAEAGYPEEIVGVLIGLECVGEDREVTESVRLENTRVENRGRRYTVDPLTLAKIERETAARGLLVLGFYHSHPDHPAEPSATDLEWAWPFYSYVIQSVRKGMEPDIPATAVEKRSWRLKEPEGFRPLDEAAFIEEEIEQI